MHKQTVQLPKRFEKSRRLMFGGEAQLQPEISFLSKARTRITYEMCDIHEQVFWEINKFNNFEFIKCQFSNCKFMFCDFTKCRFIDCEFIPGCVFYKCVFPEDMTFFT